MLTTQHASTDDGLGSGNALGGGSRKKAKEWKTSGDVVKERTEAEQKVVDLLHAATKKGDADIVASLVNDSRIHPDTRDLKGWSPLLRATKGNQYEVLTFLLHITADVGIQTRTGNTALHKAVKGNLPELAEKLLDAQADPNIQNAGGATPLMLAVMHKHCEDMMHVILSKSADVNAQKDVGYSALMIAARFGNTGAVKFLIEYSQDQSLPLDLEMTDKQGETAMVKAVKHRKNDTVELLKSVGAVEHVMSLPSQHSQGHSHGRRGSTSEGNHSSHHTSGHRQSSHHRASQHPGSTQKQTRPSTRQG